MRAVFIALRSAGLRYAWPLVLAAGLGLAGGAVAEPRQAFLGPASEGCSACFALVISTAETAEPWLAKPAIGEEADRIAAAARERGFSVTRLADAPAYRLIYHLNRFFAEAGAAPEARLLLWYGGRVRRRDDRLVLAARNTAADPDPEAPALDGLAIDTIARAAMANSPARSVIVLDAVLPGDESHLPLRKRRPPAGDPAHLLFATTNLKPKFDPSATLEALLRKPEAVGLGAIRDALGQATLSGYLVEPGATVPGAAGPGRAGGEAGTGDRPPARSPFAPADLTALLDGPLAAPAASETEVAAAERCNQLATDPEDPTAPTPGGPIPRTKAEQAAAACLKAMLAEPENARLVHQYARALDARGRRAATRWYAKAADLGHAAAEAAYARKLWRGEGVERNPGRAIRLFERAAEAGVPTAALVVAKLKAEGDRMRRDRAGAIALLRPYAEHHARHAYLLAQLLERDLGRDEEAVREVLALYKRAADDGHARARAGMRRMQDLLDSIIADKQAPKPSLANCDKLLSDVDIVAIESLYDLPLGQSRSHVYNQRIQDLFQRIDPHAVVEICGPLMTGKAPADLVARYAYVLYQANEMGFLSEDEAGDFRRLAKRAALMGAPTGQYLYGHLQMGFSLTAGYGAATAEQYLEDAYRNGIRQAGLLLAQMHIDPSWRGRGRMRQDPERGIQLFEELSAVSPLARKVLHKIYSDPAALGLPRRYRKPGRARQLFNQL